jgi:hypothetical protein
MSDVVIDVVKMTVGENRMTVGENVNGENQMTVGENVIDC